MKYKAISLTIISIISLLTACDANEVDLTTQLANDEISAISLRALPNPSSLSDGHYFAQENTYSTDGWKNIVDIEVTNGKIESVSFDAVNEQATNYKKELSVKGDYTLTTNTNPSLPWHSQLEILEKYLIKHQTYDNLQVEEDGSTTMINGLTMNVNPYIELVKQAINLGPQEKGPYQDGQYHASTLDATNHFTYTINLVVNHGYIVAAHWNGLQSSESEDSSIPSPDITDWNKEWEDQATLLEQYLIEIQDPSQMTFNENNKTEDVNGVTIDVHQFIELAIKALGSGPIME